MGQFAGLRLDGDLEDELRRALGDAVKNVLDRETNSGRYVDALSGPLRRPATSPPTDVQSSAPSIT
jgi:hypothetical protein